MTLIRYTSLALAAASLAACGLQGTDSEEQDAQATENQAQQTDRDGYDDEQTAAREEARFEDGKVELTLPDGVTREALGDRTDEMLVVQVLLDQTAHAPGVIDGFGGDNTDDAIRYYRKANDLGDSTQVDEELLQALFDDAGGNIFRTYTVTEADAEGPCETLPEDFADMADLKQAGYETPLEMLAEKFHMDQDFLEALNPEADFGKAGTKLVIVSHGDGEPEGDVARIEIRKDDGRLVAFDDEDTMVASYPASIGSSEFPSPSGTMKVAAVAPEPNYTFDADKQEWGQDKTFVIQPGPNNPVGSTWIDLTKEGYGIHGTPDPHMIAKGNSHGCVRLTNWNATALAKAVKQGVDVVFA